MIEFSLKVLYDNPSSAESQVAQYKNSLMTEMAIAADIAKWKWSDADYAVVTQYTNGNFKVVLFKGSKQWQTVEVAKQGAPAQKSITEKPSVATQVSQAQFPHVQAFAQRKDDFYNTVYRHTQTGQRYSVICSSGVALTDTTINGGVTLVTLVGEDGRIWHRPIVEFFDGRFERLP